MINAKSITDKFWILTDESGIKCGTIQVNMNHQYVAFINGYSSIHDTLDDCFNSHEIKSAKSDLTLPTDEEFKIESYPINTRPFNTLYSMELKAYVFSKNEKSKSQYAAGYFIIKFNSGWALVFCPKVVTLKEYEWHGPFSSKLEARHQLTTLDI